MRRVACLLFAVGLSSAALAYADQCQVVEVGVAVRAVQAIQASHGRVLDHCAPCGDPPPSLSRAFTPRAVASGGDSVSIDGTERDLAYLYLEVAPNVFENVALRTGCPADGIPQVWDFTSGTPRARAFGPPPAALRPFGWGGTGPAVRPLPPG